MQHHPNYRFNRAKYVMWGILAIAIGVYMLLANLNVIPDWEVDFRRQWPAILVLVGMLGFAGDGLRKSVAGHSALIIVGGLLLASHYHWIPGWHGSILELWPVFVIALGLDLLLSRRRDRSRDTQSGDIPANITHRS